MHGVPPRDAQATQYIGFVTRVIAFAIDAAVINVVALLVAVVIALVSSVLPTSHDRDKVLVAIGGVVFAIWIVGYFVAFWTTTGQTPGNRLMQIGVERADGSRMLPRHAIARLIGILASLPLFLGFVPILVTERRRGLHDWMAGTVVKAAPRESGPFR